MGMLIGDKVETCYYILKEDLKKTGHFGADKKVVEINKYNL